MKKSVMQLRLQSLLFSVFLINVFTLHLVCAHSDDFDDDKLDSGIDVDEDEPDQSSSPRASVPKTTEKAKFIPPRVSPNAYYAMYFTAPSNLASHWVISQAKKDGVDSALSKYDGLWSVEVPETSAIEGDYGLVVKSKVRHHAIAAKLDRLYKFETGKTFVVQYEVKFQNGMECGGAYIKLLTDSNDLNLKQFHDKTPYTIMFGPDKCGLDYKLHFIFRHKNPNTGELEEKHSNKPKGDLEKYFNDKKTHLYTLVINPDNSFEVYVDQTLVNSGNLLEDFNPPVNPSKEIDDPTDKKPADWDDRAKIADPDAKKPDDWDESAPEMIVDEGAEKPAGWLEEEPLTIPDPNAQKPKDWDEEMDGEWEAAKIDNPVCKDAPGCGPWTKPKIKNPVYKGKWYAPMIDNPAYKGVWKPRRIENPNYYEDKEPYKMSPIAAVGLELWTLTDGIVFDNFIITDNKKDADDFASQTFEIKRIEERRVDPNAQSVVDAIRDALSEKPWLWAVILLVIALPIVLLIVYCCRRPSSSGSGRPQHQHLRADAVHKKTDDAHQPPDAREGDVGQDEEGSGADGVDDEDADDNSEGEAEATATIRKTTTSKASLEHQPKESTTNQTASSGSEEDEPQPTEDANKSSQAARKDGSKKRGSRKDN